jgi:hypothetical protein
VNLVRINKPVKSYIPIRNTILDSTIYTDDPNIFEEPKWVVIYRFYLGIGDFEICLVLWTSCLLRPLYRITSVQNEEYLKQISNFNRNSLIGNSHFSFTALLLCLPTLSLSDGSCNIYIVYDYRILNNITVKDYFLLHLPNELNKNIEDKK